jgi:membrane protein YqaA with SNARE-associated domain
MAITVLIYLFRNQLSRFSSYGYLGLFVVSVVGNATILLPMPSLAATFVAGRILNPWLVGLVSAAGMSIGELSGYLAGYGGTAIVEAKNRERHERLEVWMRRHGFLTIVVLAAIPNPLFDLAGVAAGMLRFPLWYFVLACFLGKLIKGIAFAFAGAGSLTWLEKLLH